MTHATSPLRLFHALVVGGAALAGACAGSPGPDALTGVDDASDSDATEADPGSESESESVPAPNPAGAPQRIVASDGDPDACECKDVGTIECSGNGITCCWANGPCCEPCCG